MLLAIWLTDFCYQQYASRRIRTIIDGVRPFASTTALSTEEAVELRIPVTDTGQFLAAALYRCPRQPRGLILFLPELDGSRRNALTYCVALRDAGFAILAIDFRSQGDSDRITDYEPIHWISEFELQDIRAATMFAAQDEELKHLPLGIVGVSRGGSAALTAGFHFPQIRAIVTDSGFTTLSMLNHFLNKFSNFVVPDWFFSKLPAWHVAATLRQALRRSERGRHCRYVHPEHESSAFRASLLMISGMRDSYVTADITRRIAAFLRQPDNVWLVPKAKHNRSRMAQTEEWDRRVIRHFTESLSPGPAADSGGVDPGPR
ncbi:MAG: alpha/beta fold hydrolase [Planctomycetaceae bacterium]|nr:alpha/beta fold hydrolase [Planctomycetaceae bacterium]